MKGAEVNRKLPIGEVGRLWKDSSPATSKHHDPSRLATAYLLMVIIPLFFVYLIRQCYVTAT